MVKIVYIYCEGQTEESFVNEILSPYFFSQEIYLTPIICTTKRTANKKHRGGVTDYIKIKHELTNLCKQHSKNLVTTMFDYYGMPKNTPEINFEDNDLYHRMQHIESSIEKDLGQGNCKFNFILHEFESLLFSKPSSFLKITDQGNVDCIQRMRDEAETPEHINNSFETAPSKRLESIIPNYAKVKNGTIISKDIGIDVMIKECAHFANWINFIKNY